MSIGMEPKAPTATSKTSTPRNSQIVPSMGSAAVRRCGISASRKPKVPHKTQRLKISQNEELVLLLARLEVWKSGRLERQKKKGKKRVIF
ncbi:hypothetical protein EMPG_15024 [Blastomyces silverae]|uniref:Uncharacterized protein n=1 Tax=Blastomyces silverae TaxID=2060906 RepID=A0A0H1BK82_9EURO|nr:hypothetical protein EMPG_15024 [Blastomyces silverae]